MSLVSLTSAISRRYPRRPRAGIISFVRFAQDLYTTTAAVRVEYAVPD